MISIPSNSANLRVVPTALSTTKPNRWTIALALPLVVGPVWCLVWREQIGWLGTLGGFVLLAALAASAVTDFQRHRIYNFVTYTAFLWALVINLTATLLSAGGSSSGSLVDRATALGPTWLGGIGVGQCLGGAAACFLFTLVAYHLSGGGAGDVKLAAVIGSFLGVYDGFFAVAYSYVVAAVFILGWSVWRIGPLALVKAGLRAVGSWLGPLWPFPPTTSDTKLLLTPIPLGPFFAIGTLFVVLERVLR
jgi:prepilin signal peptidase PulO-like enzyme (type II secretory pathway)